MDYTDNAVTSTAQNSFKMAIRTAGQPSESTACIHAIFFRNSSGGTAQEFKLLSRRSATRGESPLCSTVSALFCHSFDACLRRRSPERLWAVRAFAGIARGEGGDGFQRGLKCTAHIGNVRVESWR